MLKEILLTHNDMDGAGCRIVFELAHVGMSKGYDYDVLNCANGNIDEISKDTIERPDIDTNTEIYYADISPSKDVLEMLISKGFKVKIFDHHATNVTLLDICPSWVIRVTNDLGELCCGTSLLYQYYSALAVSSLVTNPSKNHYMYFRDDYGTKLLANFVECIRLYDTWEWKRLNMVEAKDLHTLYFLLGMDRFCNRFINRIIDKEGDNVILDTDWEFINAKGDYERKIIDEFIEIPGSIIDTDIQGYRTALTIGTRGASISELASRFLSAKPEFDLFINLSIGSNPKFFSIRTIKDYIDVSEFAKNLGGGGHVSASGAPLNDKVYEAIIAIIIDSLSMKNDTME